jgi:hypothetical protein
MLHLSDYLNGTTAEFKQVPSSTNGDGHDHDSAQGHVHNGGNNHRRRVRHQIQHGRRWSAVKADNAIMMVEVCGLQVADAIERCGTNSNAYYAQKALRSPATLRSAIP